MRHVDKILMKNTSGDNSGLYVCMYGGDTHIIVHILATVPIHVLSKVSAFWSCTVNKMLYVRRYILVLVPLQH